MPKQESSLMVQHHRRRLSCSVLASMSVLCVLVMAAAQTARASAAPDAIVLTEGVTYRARLRLSFFQCLAPRARIEGKLGGGGFARVRVFMSARDLPSDWPARYRRKVGSCERFAEGIWARPTTPRQRPSSIDAWWVAEPGVAP